MKKIIGACLGIVLVAIGVWMYILKNPKLVIPQHISEVVKLDKLTTSDPVVAVVGDIACNSDVTTSECYQKQTADLIKQLDPHAILVVGDLQYPRGSLEDFKKYYDKTWGAFKSKLYPVPGNHEYETKNATGYFDYFNGQRQQNGQAGDRDKGYYSFDLKDWHVIAINSNCWAVGGCGVESDQYKWVTQDLQRHQTSCTLAFWHHPLFSSAQHGGTDEMQELWDLLVSKNVDLVINGHEHVYERFAPMNLNGEKNDQNGTREIIAGTGGRSLYQFNDTQPNSEFQNNTTYGVLFLVLHQNNYEWKFQPIDSKEALDSGKSECH